MASIGGDDGHHGHTNGSAKRTGIMSPVRRMGGNNDYQPNADEAQTSNTPGPNKNNTVALQQIETPNGPCYLLMPEDLPKLVGNKQPPPKRAPIGNEDSYGVPMQVGGGGPPVDVAAALDRYNKVMEQAFSNDEFKTRKMTHNMVEKRRRDKIKDGIMKLNNLLPEQYKTELQTTSKKFARGMDTGDSNVSVASKGIILEKAVQYVQELQHNVEISNVLSLSNEQLNMATLQLRNDTLETENQRLREAIEQMGMPLPEGVESSEQAAQRRQDTSMNTQANITNSMHTPMRMAAKRKIMDGQPQQQQQQQHMEQNQQHQQYTNQQAQQLLQKSLAR